MTTTVRNALASADQNDGTMWIERYPTSTKKHKNDDFFALYHHGSIPTSLPIAPSQHIKQSDSGILNIAYFPQRIFQMLETIKHSKCHLSNIVSWNPTGSGFVIHDPDAFVSQVMPVFFQSQSKLSSFRRQLNNYGFKHTHDVDNVRELTYYHQFFLRDDPKSCRKIVLKNFKKRNKAHLRISRPSTSVLFRKEEARLSLLFGQVALPRLDSSSSGRTITCSPDKNADHDSATQGNPPELFSLIEFNGDDVLDAAASEIFYPTEGEKEQDNESILLLLAADERPGNSATLEDELACWDPTVESLDTVCFNDMLF